MFPIPIDAQINPVEHKIIGRKNLRIHFRDI